MPQPRRFFARLGSFALLPRADRRLLVEAGGALLFGAGVALLPLRFYARWLGSQSADPVNAAPNAAGAQADIQQDRVQDGVQTDQVRRVGWAIRTIAGRVPFRSDCLPQALAARVMLGRRGLPVTVVFGAALRDEALKAHAWARCGGVILTGNAARRGFAPVAAFTHLGSADEGR
ncbi:MAG: lasso peptide biosynthesis B2 protein [Anaerolineae bacterium]|nr:lasso peptide biosynthesis B2 protein [Anaerolineae bacterium]NUQ06626.1 lasso peptide biosynthesis B2 protein [Anaerolineae bacterium]